MTGRRAVVVGGGMAGLVAAYQLAERGLRPLVLEASAAVGGPVARHTVAGIALDAGAESFAVARPAVTELLTDLGLAETIVSPAPLGSWIRHDGGTAPSPAGALLGIPGRPLAADVRRVIGTAGSLRAAMDAVLPPRFSAPTLGELVRRRMGTRVLHRLVETVVGGVHAADPSVLETDAVVPGLTDAIGNAGSLTAAVRGIRGRAGAAGSAVAGIRGGMAGLPTALAQAITARGGEIRCRTEVIRLRRATADDDAAAWLLETGAGPLPADLLVIALPAGPTRLLLGSVIGHQLIPEGGQSTPVALVTLVVDAPGLDHAPRGTGILVAPRATGVRAKALTHATAKWPWLAGSVPAGRHVLRLSYGRGGFADPALAPPTPGDADLPGIALADAAELLGVRLPEAAVVGSAVVHWPSSLPQARTGHTAAVAGLRRALAGQPGLAVVGSAFSGTGLAAVVGDARRQVSDLLTRSPGAGKATAPPALPDSSMGEDGGHE